MTAQMVPQTTVIVHWGRWGGGPWISKLKRDEEMGDEDLANINHKTRTAPLEKFFFFQSF